MEAFWKRKPNAGMSYFKIYFVIIFFISTNSGNALQSEDASCTEMYNTGNVFSFKSRRHGLRLPHFAALLLIL